MPICSRLLCGTAALASAFPVPVEPPPTLAAVEVAGVMPGPGLWQVRRNDHVLWLIGSLSPVPRRTEWRSARLDARLAEADAILAAPSFTVIPGRGMLHAMTLVPSVLGARSLPDGQTPADVLAPGLHARWSALKAERAGLSFESPVFDHVDEAAKRRTLPRIPAMLAISIDDSRLALSEFRQGDLEDVDCFERNLQRLEGDVAQLSARARAWTTSDMAQPTRARQCGAAAYPMRPGRQRPQKGCKAPHGRGLPGRGAAGFSAGPSRCGR